MDICEKLQALGTMRRQTALLAGALLMLSCSALAQDTGWVITTDYSTFGQVREVTTSAPWSVSGDLAAIPGDAVGRIHDGMVYIVGRGTANIIQIFDPAGGFTLVREFSIGAGRNPQDIAFAPDGTAFVSCYDSAELIAVDVTTGTVTASYSTADFADADGLPETGWMTAVDDRLYVAAQMLDRDNWYVPAGPGAVLVFDMVNRLWVDQDSGTAGLQPIVLTGSDPYTDFQVFNVGESVHARVGCVGSFGVTDGGIEEIDLTAGTSLGFLVTEAQLGGDVTRFVQVDGVLYVLISDASFITHLVRWEVASSNMTVMAIGSGYVYADLALAPGHQLFVADRTVGASGLRVWDTGTGVELTSGVLDTGLPPFMMIFPRDFLSPVPTVPMATLAMGAPYPNPGNPRMHVEMNAAPYVPVNITVVDLRGRVVRRAQVETDGQGRARFEFDGRDQGGRSVASGLYRIVGTRGSSRVVRSWTLIR